MNLGQLIDGLAALPAGDYVGYSDGQYVEIFYSWRGVYSELTLAPTTQAERATSTVGALLKIARSADGHWFTGYKGGDYQMNRHTAVWADGYGEYSGYAITRIDHLPKSRMVVLVRERVEED